MFSYTSSSLPSYKRTTPNERSFSDSPSGAVYRLGQIPLGSSSPFGCDHSTRPRCSPSSAVSRAARNDPNHPPQVEQAVMGSSAQQPSALPIGSRISPSLAPPTSTISAGPHPCWSLSGAKLPLSLASGESLSWVPDHRSPPDSPASWASRLPRVRPPCRPSGSLQ